MPDALIIDACRTPRGIGKVDKGALAHLHPQHLGATVLKAIAERHGAQVDLGEAPGGGLRVRVIFPRPS